MGDMVSAMDMATVSTTARGRLRLRPSPTTMVLTVLDMVDSTDMVSAMDMATVSTTARGRPRPSPTTMGDMEGTDMPAPTEDSTVEDTTGDKSSGPPSPRLDKGRPTNAQY